MSYLIEEGQNIQHLLMGNEAIVRGALEAGVNIAAGYPGTPSSEIIESFSKVAKERNLYVEWSTNEKVAVEVAAAGSFAGLRSLCVMKQNGVNVASDFLLHLASSGTRGGMILVSCDDPGALSSVNEGESRLFARLLEIPLLEPGGFQEAKDIIPWAFALSEQIRNIVMVRSVTRMSHASGNVRFGPLPDTAAQAVFHYNGPLLDPDTGPVISMILAAPELQHGPQLEKMKKAAEIFETCPFNTYTGPDNPELIIITSSACSLYSREAVAILGLEERVGILKLATTWPLPRRLLTGHLARAARILFVEEVAPTLEDHVKIIAAETAAEIGVKTFYGKKSGHLPAVGELNPDLVINALAALLSIPYEPLTDEFSGKLKDLAVRYAPPRGMTFCPGCPHRASYWSIHNALELDGRRGFVCGDIGCYVMGTLPAGFSTVKTLHAMGSGSGIASGFGKLKHFGMDQPVLSVCGDSTFFHAAMPALANAIHQRSPITMVLLDNRGTAMTGFQPHPGSPANVLGDPAPALDMEKLCRAMGAKVEVCDPFDLEKTRRKLNHLLEYAEGAKVLILRQACALSPERRGKKKYEMVVDESRCHGEDCGCNRLCTRIFGCPGLVWDREKKVSRIDDIICVGCGVCADICPAGAIVRKEIA
ncbi:MAG TPA: thiamine pyrophosphate-dependent enzyme [Syntrophales bacterium]|nr:thiamine pyrophosphate-dependent enzyme [Syntrophales bacterium]